MELKQLIERRIQNFFGYGSLDAPVWFVGMEEGLGHKSDIDRKLEIRFRAADGKVVIDMRKDLRELEEHMKWFERGGKIQPTWKYPIALYLFFRNKNRSVTKEEIRHHQTVILGDCEIKETVTIELMPLPAQKADEATWLYAKYGISGLTTRREYIETYKAMRIIKLRALIEKHKPRLIIFFSLKYREDWVRIMGEDAKEITRQFYFGTKNETSFCITPQSSMPGMSYARLYEFAEKIKTQVKL